MINLEILEDGKCILNRDISKGEIIEYQNNYLKSINKSRKVVVLADLNKDDILYAGAMVKGEIVIDANEDTDDYLIVKRQI